MSKKRITVKEVAREAGVSTQTVSRVVNDRPDVAAGTRQRVQQVIDRMGYQPSYVARSLSRGRSRTLGVIGYGLEYFGPSCTLSGIERQASDLGYTVLLSLIRRPETDDVEDLLGEMLSRHVDGVIWAVPQIGGNRVWVQQQKPQLPVPILFLSMEPISDQFVVAVDNYNGGLLATRHLISRDHQNVGLICGPFAWWESRERMRGWRDALQGAGLSGTDDFVVEGNWTATSGEQALKVLLNRCPQIDSVFVCNDRMALGALTAARELGRRVPQDLAVVGFDDIPDAAYFCPSLSTVHQGLVELGRRAVRELGRVLEANREDVAAMTRSVLLQPRLVVRESSVVGS